MRGEIAQLQQHLHGQVHLMLRGRKLAEAEPVRVSDIDFVSTQVLIALLGQVMSVSSPELLGVRFKTRLYNCGQFEE